MPKVSVAPGVAYRPESRLEPALYAYALIGNPVHLMMETGGLPSLGLSGFLGMGSFSMRDFKGGASNPALRVLHASDIDLLISCHHIYSAMIFDFH